MLAAFMLWGGIVRSIEIALLVCMRVDAVGVLVVRVVVIVLVIVPIAIGDIFDRVLYP